MARFNESSVKEIIALALDRIGKDANDLTNEELLNVLASAIYESIGAFSDAALESLGHEIKRGM
ncbi:MAG: hypothetical protein M0T74_07855 [Desulfitobacterium hafniense]|nr:hypothetical protein [Desulfitobacterium hafniense]